MDDGISSYAYQWQINDGSGWTNIGDATSASLNIPGDQSYVGKDVRLTATTTDGFGGTTDFTSAAQTVANVNDAPTAVVLSNTVASTPENGARSRLPTLR